MSTEIQTAVKVETGLADKSSCRAKRHRDIYRQNSLPNMPYKKHKQQQLEENRHKCCRKKPQHSFAGGNCPKQFLQHKKRKKFIPPTKFLLGGNINDPLNLNSLQDEEINRRMNAVTPQSSPLPTATAAHAQHHHRKGGGEVEVIIPANINDPLNLAGGEDEDDGGVAYAAFLTATTPKRKRHKRKRHRSSTGSNKEEVPDAKSDESKTDDAFEGDTVDSGVTILPTKGGIEIEVEKKDTGQQDAVEVTKSEIIKPTHLDLTSQSQNTIPLAAKEFKKPKRGGSGDDKEGSVLGRSGCKKFDKDKIVSPVIPQPGAWTAGMHRFRKPAQRPPQHTPNFKEQNKRFQYGNYNRYYGYRNPNHEADPRLKLLAMRRELFEGKDVLDLGCNTGHVTLSVARDFGARTVVGLDLDRTLVEAARANMRRHRPNAQTKQFPLSMPVTYGPLDVPGIHSSTGFPNNVSFVQGNYVLQSDVLVELEQPQFDVILCLSVTKWLHLNWGDTGLKRAFKRMFAQLRPGGTLILEPQPWTSYKRKKNLTETIWKNYQVIKLFPTMFTQYLLTEVGFSKCEVIGAPVHQSRGFQRPIKVFTKGETPLSSRTPIDKRESEQESRPLEKESTTVGVDLDNEPNHLHTDGDIKSSKVPKLDDMEEAETINHPDLDASGETKTTSQSSLLNQEGVVKETSTRQNGVKRKLSESDLHNENAAVTKRLLTDTQIDEGGSSQLSQNISNGFIFTKENCQKQSPVQYSESELIQEKKVEVIQPATNECGKVENSPKR